MKNLHPGEMPDGPEMKTLLQLKSASSVGTAAAHLLTEYASFGP